MGVIRPGLLVVLAAVALDPLVHAQAGETITATANVKTAGAEAALPVTVRVDRFWTDPERDQVLESLKKGGTAEVRKLLASKGAIGSLQVGKTNTPIKYAYSRLTGSGRLITVITDSPIAFLGAGEPGAPPTKGFDLGLVLLQVPLWGAGSGELAPAATVRMDEEGAIVTDDYGAEVVRLTNVTGKSGVR
jgi:hypothetical protein